MIVDSQAHIFEKWSGACGLPSREVHWKYIQKNLTRPAAKVFRYRDGAPGDAANLFCPGDNTWAIRYGDTAWKYFLDMWADHMVASGFMQERYNHYLDVLEKN